MQMSFLFFFSSCAKSTTFHPPCWVILRRVTFAPSFTFHTLLRSLLFFLTSVAAEGLWLEWGCVCLWTMCRFWMMCPLFFPLCPRVEEIPKCHQDLISTKLLFDALWMLRTRWHYRKLRENTSPKVWHSSWWSQACGSVTISQCWDYRGWEPDCAAYIVFPSSEQLVFSPPPSTWWSSWRRGPASPSAMVFWFHFPISSLSHSDKVTRRCHLQY